MTIDPEPAEFPSEGETEFFTTLTDELYDDLVNEVGSERIVGVALWEESLVDDSADESPSPEQRTFFDLDLYLENKISLELYGTAAYTDLDGDPLRGLERFGRRFASMVEQGLWLEEVAADEDDELVLVLSRNHQPQLYLSVGGWSLAEWDELPEVD